MSESLKTTLDFNPLLKRWADLEPECCRNSGSGFEVKTDTLRIRGGLTIGEVKWETVWNVENTRSSDLATIQLAVEQAIEKRTPWTCSLSLERFRFTHTAFWVARVWADTIPHTSGRHEEAAIALLDAYLEALNHIEDDR